MKAVKYSTIIAVFIFVVIIFLLEQVVGLPPLALKVKGCSCVCRKAFGLFLKRKKSRIYIRIIPLGLISTM
jgi:hypothetical protein